jgi:hypothetical protein
MTELKDGILESRPDDIPFGTSGLETPTYFADYIRGTMVSAGVVKLNFVENRLDAFEGGVKTVHVATIITPLHQIRAWAKYMTDLADQNGLPEILPDVVGPNG